MWPFTPSTLLLKAVSLPASQQEYFCLFPSLRGAFNSLMIFSNIYFWQGKECGGCFVGLTWKCFFYSTSCFHRPFVTSNSSVYVCVCVCFVSVGSRGRGSRTFLNFTIISCSFSKFPSTPLPVHLGLNALVEIFVYVRVKKKAALMGSGQRPNSLFTTAGWRRETAL